MIQLRKPFQHTQTLVIKEVREQIQEDMIAYCEAKLPFDYKESQSMTDDFCQIVVDNFKRLEDK